MSATTDHHETDVLTIDLEAAEGGWWTARILEEPGAISQGPSREQARANVLDALHDLRHEPTPTERVVYAIQARVVEPLLALTGR